MGLGRNEDRVREAIDGVRTRRQTDGSIVKETTPYRCCQCTSDACYGIRDKWYCTEHRQQLDDVPPGYWDKLQAEISTWAEVPEVLTIGVDEMPPPLI